MNKKLTHINFFAIITIMITNQYVNINAQDIQKNCIQSDQNRSVYSNIASLGSGANDISFVSTQFAALQALSMTDIKDTITALANSPILTTSITCNNGAADFSRYNDYIALALQGVSDALSSTSSFAETINSTKTVMGYIRTAVVGGTDTFNGGSDSLLNNPTTLITSGYSIAQVSFAFQKLYALLEILLYYQTTPVILPSLNN